MTGKPDREGMGAASGLLATLMFVLGFVVFMTTDPTGGTPYPSIKNAQQAPAYLALHLSRYRLELLFVSLGVVLFLWFAGSLHATLRKAEGDQGRGSTLAMAAAGVAAGLMLVSLVLGFTCGLSTSPSQAAAVPTLYTAAALLFAFGGATLALFFFAVAKVVLQTNALARWLGILASIAAFLCLLGFLTPFFDSGALNAATGALGLWTWYGAFVVWVFLASLALIARQRQPAAVKAPAAAPAEPRMNATGGEVR